MHERREQQDAPDGTATAAMRNGTNGTGMHRLLGRLDDGTGMHRAAGLVWVLHGELHWVG